jgi:hypothetical protein
MTDCEVGDWVSGPISGIWRVYRRERSCNLAVPGVSSTPPPGGLVFASRFLNALGRYRPDDYVWHLSLTHPLSLSQKLLLVHAMRWRAQSLAAFLSHHAQTPDLLYNVPLAMPAEVPKELPEHLAALLQDGLSRLEIIQHLEHSAFAPYINQRPSTAQLQFRCVGHELRATEFVFRSVRWI